MRIAFDTSALVSGHKVRGIGFMVDEQIKALKQESEKHSNISIETFDFASASGKQKLQNGKYDIVQYPYFFPFAPTLPEQKLDARVVVMIQDLIHLLHPKQYPPGIRGKRNLIRQKARLKNIDRILTISDASKDDIIKFLGVDPKIVKRIHLAPRKIFKPISDKQKLKKVKKKYNLHEKFVLYVGDVNYNKNIPTLINACESAKTSLVIVGKHAVDIENSESDLRQLKGPRDWVRYLLNIPHPELKHFNEIKLAFQTSENITRLGFVSESDLVSIYNLATVYCQPSLSEGFGLPVLEAMACGTAVISSNTPALMEITGSAALHFNATSSIDLSEKIDMLISNDKYRISLEKKGLEHVKKFSWKKVGKEMIDWYSSFNDK